MLKARAEGARLGARASPLHRRKTLHHSPQQCSSSPGTLFHKSQKDHRRAFSLQSQSLRQEPLSQCFFPPREVWRQDPSLLLAHHESTIPFCLFRFPSGQQYKHHPIFSAGLSAPPCTVTKALQAALQSRLQKTNMSQPRFLRSFNPAFPAHLRNKSAKTIRIKFPSKFLSIELRILALATSTATSPCPSEGHCYTWQISPVPTGHRKQGASLG